MSNTHFFVCLKTLRLQITAINVMVLLASNQHATAQHQGSNYPQGIPVNYIRTWDALAPEQDANKLLVRPPREVRQATQYLDGLGRPLQTVIREGSLVTGGNATDLVSPVEYDAFGREQYKWLPYAEPSANNGSFKTTPFTAQVAFYNSSNPASPIANQAETYFYSKTNYEPSPLNRVTDTYAPGNSWAGSEGNAAPQQRNVQIKYSINTLDDKVHIWKVTDNALMGAFGTYDGTATYPAGELYKTITTDEQKKQVIEFKDKEGKVILKKVQLTALDDDGTGKDYTGWLSTYYIYDDLGNLRCVIQPEGVKALAQPMANWQLSTTLLAEQCFRYEYDQRNRMIVKKVPGAGEVNMVYDPWDRLVLTQDANQRTSHQYLMTKFDALNRPVMTGIYTTNSSLQDVRTAAANNTTNRFETRTTNSNNYGYTSQCWPTNNYDVLTATYYDDYDWVAANGGMFSVNRNPESDGNFLPASNTSYPYPQAMIQSFATKGMVTGTYTKVLGTVTNPNLWGIVFYDDKGRVIQTNTYNITGQQDMVNTQYDFAGKPLITEVGSRKIFANSRNEYTFTYFEYDDLGRLLRTKKKPLSYNVNTNTWYDGGEKIIAENEYNALGQLKKKKLAPGYNNGTGLETENFDYNIRGWMLGMNREYIKNTEESGYNKHYFSFELGYDKAANNSGANFYHSLQYNGNITGMVWKSAGDEVRRKYDFNYDAANRLGTADFTQNTKTTWGGSFTNTAMDFSVYGDNPANNWFMKYDDNGNILSMVQRGFKLGVPPSTPIDQLSYSYQPNSNKLLGVTDAYNDKDSKLGDFKYDPATKTAVDYTYDDNGNLTVDKNKNISSIAYNHLNLPQLITIKNSNGTTKGTITYTYDAAGNKLKKVTEEYPVSANNNISTFTTTTYIGGAVYESKTDNDPNTTDYTDKLQFIGMEEGRIRWKETDNSFQYDYMLKDHLGNVRMVLTEEQKQDKYPTATLETPKLAAEKNFYDIKDAQIQDIAINPVPGLPSYTNNNGIGNNPGDPGFENTSSQKLYKLNSSTTKTGLGITLKVMAGDKIDVFGKSYYFQNTGGTGGNSTVPVLDLLNAFLGAPGAATATAGHGAVSGTTINVPDGLSGINSMATQQDNQSNGAPYKPRAFINVIFFDEQFKTYTGGFKISMVGDNSIIKDHYADLQNLIANKSGYVYIYCSNESPVDVFFDNIQVVHTRGAILEESHYYPFGLTMAGISSKAAGNMPNKDKTFQGQKFDDDLDLNWVQFKWRNHDPQIGRFIEIDPLANDYVYNSTYAFSENKVTSDFELEGLESLSMHYALGHAKAIKEYRLEQDYQKAVRQNEAYELRQEQYARSKSNDFFANLQSATNILINAAAIYVTPVEGSVEESEVTFSSKSGSSTITQNAARGTAFEQKVVANMASEGHTGIAQQVTIKAANGIKTRLDVASKNVAGALELTEAKSSSTAPLTKIQQFAFPSIAQNGGVVVGKGKPGLPGGTVIPATPIYIVRPKIEVYTSTRPVVPLVIPPKTQN